MSKLYAFSDCHGDIDLVVKLLQEKNLIDGDTNWIGGDAKLIHGGDLTDRGFQGIECIQLMMQLEKQSAQVGGFVTSLMGNHDALILTIAYEMLGQETPDMACSIFKMNGGKEYEATKLSENPEMMEWMKNRPLMHKEGKYLFQHADTARYYKSMGNTIADINKHGLEQAQTGNGAWAIFYRMCDCRYWDGGDEQYVSDYLESFGTKVVLHGHTRFVGSEPLVYRDGLCINLDGSMSIGYRSDPSRGFLLELD